MRAVLTTLLFAAATALPVLAQDGAQDRAQDPDGPGVQVPVEIEAAPVPQVPLRAMPARSAWTEAHVDALAVQLFEAPSHGLPSLDDTAFQLSNPTIDLAERVVLAERAFMRFGGWLRFGLVDQESLDARRLDNAERNLLIAGLSDALVSGDFAAVFADFAPRVRDYEILRQEMIRLTALQPIWPGIEAGESLSTGDSGVRVDQLRARLAAEGLYPGAWEEGDAFDMRLETAVRRFQGRVNLAPTGRMDQNTLRQLNIQPQARIAQLRSNMEQRRWRERDLGRRHIWVNIADFHLEAWEDGELVREHQVMVGRAASSTPEFSDMMEYLVINPWWGVPTGSARSRFRSIRRNPNVAAYHGFRIFDASGQAVRPYQVDWSRWGTGSWPYRLSQAPGPTNPMGEVKFIFPNRHNVYIHDTTERDQFVRTRRDFSAGCIRVQDPFALAEWILDGQDGYDRARLDEVAAGNTPDVVWLDEQLPVHIAYWTVVGDSDGEVRYLNDLYRRDNRLIEAYMAAYNAVQPDQDEVAAVYESLAASLN
ncbi:L,D-transpeptidase family protein [Maricaulis sp.]|uniref:L,D-transpeptidase family protein n=1 Tax=Maricaulis sp. TaxID=1486257 RepID=UPI002620E0F5|nr:L,D-transpeptidase family protein [Maricaulis sp.]